MKRTIPLVLFIVGIMIASFGSAGGQEDQLAFVMVGEGGRGNPFFIPMMKEWKMPVNC